MMDPTVLEVALKNRNRDERIHKILNIEEEFAVPVGQNFLSVIKRLRMKVVHGNGRVSNCSAIMKSSEIASEAHSTFANELGVFRTEIIMYNTVLKEMEYLLTEHNNAEEIPWSRLLHYEPYSTMIFEDLKALGFKSLLIPCYLDLDHVLLVVRNLGLFHGMSKILEERGTINVNNFPRWYVFNKTSYKIWRSYLMEFASVIDKNWNPSWKPMIAKLKNLTVEDVEERLEEISKYSDQCSFKVMNHGDLMVPNLMFKYDWRNRPISMRFLDFQLSTFGTPCFDLVYFLYRSITAASLKENLRKILECYHSSFMNTLDKFNYKGTRLTLNELIEGMDRVSFLGNILFIVNYSPMITSQGDFGDDLHKERIFSIFNRQESEEELGPGMRELAIKHLS